MVFQLKLFVFSLNFSWQYCAVLHRSRDPAEHTFSASYGSVVRLCMLWSKMGIREFIQAFIIFQWVLYSFNASCKGGETRHNIWFKYILFTRGVRCPHFSLASGDYNLVTSMFLLTVIEVTAALSKLWNFLSYEEISFGPSWRTKNVIERLNFHIVTSLDCYIQI